MSRFDVHACCLFWSSLPLHVLTDTYLHFLTKDFWRTDMMDVLEHVRKNPDAALTVLKPLVLQGTAVKGDAWCLRHGRHCKIQTASRHIAGTVCVGFSRRGVGLSTADPTMLPTLAWVALRRLCQEPEIVQENVRGCPVQLFHDLLHDIYYLDVVTIDAVVFGWSCGRERQFIKMRHRWKILEQLSPCSRHQPQTMAVR